MLYKSLVTCGTLSVLLLNDRGINLFQFLLTVIQIHQKEAFLLSTLTSVPKKYMFNEKVSRNKMQGDISHKSPQTVPLIKRVFSAFSIVSLFCNPIIYAQYEQYMLVYQLWVTCWLLNHGSSFFFQKKKLKGPIFSDRVN